MKAIRVRLGDVSIVCKICDRRMVAYTACYDDLCSRAELQNDFDESFDDGFISRRLQLSMSTLILGDEGGRWDSRLLLLDCVGRDDCLAAFCQPLLGQFFFAVIGERSDEGFWQSLVKEMLIKYGYTDFNLLFNEIREASLFERGVQIWSSGDCGMGERHLDEILITGYEEMLMDIYNDLENGSACDFSAKFITNEKGFFEWVDL